MAPLDNIDNFVRGAVASSIGSADTTISVVDASIYPDPSVDNYNLVLWDAASYARPDQDPDVEVVRVTGRDTGTDTLTVSRGQEGTTAVAHPASSQLTLSYTAKFLNDVEAEFNAFWDSTNQQLTADVNNNSVETGKQNNTWHFPDPADNCAGIREAISDADAGDTIYLREGVYEADRLNSEGDNVLIDKALRVTGSGEGSVIKTPDNFSSTDGIRLIRSTPSVAWVQFDHIKIDGNVQNNATNTSNDGHNLKPQGGNVFVHDVVSIDSTGDGIACSGDNILVHNNRSENNFENNIHVNTGEAAVITSNICRGEDSAGSIMLRPVSSGDVVDTAIVAANTILSPNSFGIHVNTNGDVVREAHVTDNVIKNAADTGILVTNQAGELSTTVSNNRIIGGSTQAIKVRQNSDTPTSTEVVVKGNEVKENANFAVLLDLDNQADVRVTDNNIRDNDGYGIYATLATNPTGIIEITNNDVVDNITNDGIRVIGNGLDHDAIIVSGNISISNDNQQDSGVRVDDIASSTISAVVDNFTVGNNFGINLAGGTPDYVYGNRPTKDLDVRNLKAETGNVGYHNGTNSNTVGPAVYRGNIPEWTSLIDGTTIS